MVSACQLCQKSDKFEPRFLAISKFRVFVIQGKNPANFKLDKSFSILVLRQINAQDKEVSFIARNL